MQFQYFKNYHKTQTKGEHRQIFLAIFSTHAIYTIAYTFAAEGNNVQISRVTACQIFSRVTHDQVDCH